MLGLIATKLMHYEMSSNMLCMEANPDLIALELYIIILNALFLYRNQPGIPLTLLDDGLFWLEFLLYFAYL